MMDRDAVNVRCFSHTHDGEQEVLDLTPYGHRVFDRAKGLVMNVLNERSMLDDPDSYGAYETVALALHFSVERTVFMRQQLKDREFWLDHSDSTLKEHRVQIEKLKELCKEHEDCAVKHVQAREAAEASEKALRQRNGQLESEIGELRASKKKLREALERSREGR
jgi:chromosome segregation ATPase